MGARGTGFSSRRPLPLEETIGFKLAIAVNLNTSVFHRDHARKFDLTLTDWRVLALLISRPGCSATELSELLAVDKMSITRAIRRLLRRGRIRAARSSQDRRRLALLPTAKGTAVYDRIAPMAWRHHESYVRDLSAAERLALDGLLQKLIASGRRLKAGDAAAEEAAA